MPVMLSPSVRVFEDRRGISQDAACLLIDNVFRRGTVTASSEVIAQNGYFENAIDGLTFDWWEPASLPAWIEVTLPVAAPVDCGLIAVHSALTFVFQYHDGDGWVNLHDAVESGTTAVIMPIFNEVTATKFRISVTDFAEGDNAYLGVVMLGKSIRMPRPFYGGHAPITFNRKTQINPLITEGGFEKGVMTLRTGAATSVTVRHCPVNWVRENLEQINNDLRIYPFGFAWRPFSEPDQVAYCWLNNEISATNNGIRDLMDVNFDFEAYIGGFAVQPPEPYIIDLLFLTDVSPRIRVIKNNNDIVSSFDAQPSNNDPYWITAKNGLIFCGSGNGGNEPAGVNLYKGNKYTFAEQQPIALTTNFWCQAGDVKNNLEFASIAVNSGFATLTNQNTTPESFNETFIAVVPNDNGAVRFSPNDSWAAQAFLFSTSQYLSIAVVSQTSVVGIAQSIYDGNAGNAARSLEWLDNSYLTILQRLGTLRIFKFNGTNTVTNIFTSTGLNTFNVDRSMSIGVNQSGANTYYIATGERFFKFNSNTESTTDLTANMSVVPPFQTLGCKWVDDRLFVCCGTGGIYVYDRVGDNLTLKEIIPSPGGGGYIGVANFQGSWL